MYKYLICIILIIVILYKSLYTSNNKDIGSLIGKNKEIKDKIKDITESLINITSD